MIEIGVGLGDLSEKLLEISSLKAYEVDSSLCSFVLQKFQKSHSNVANDFTLLQCDVLSIPFKNGWLNDEPYILVSNLPYYIATRIIVNVLKDPLCKGFVVMTQKEVAQKFCAQEKQSNFCALSVLLQSVGVGTMLFDVAPECFTPAPKVFSSVFRVIKHSLDETTTDSTAKAIESDFEQMLQAAFCAPRKKLLNNLATKYDKTLIARIFDDLRLSPHCRAHEISTQEYHQIYNKIKRINDGE